MHSSGRGRSAWSSLFPSPICLTFVQKKNVHSITGWPERGFIMLKAGKAWSGRLGYRFCSHQQGASGAGRGALVVGVWEALGRGWSSPSRVPMRMTPKPLVQPTSYVWATLSDTWRMSIQNRNPAISSFASGQVPTLYRYYLGTRFKGNQTISSPRLLHLAARRKYRKAKRLTKSFPRR